MKRRLETLAILAMFIVIPSLTLWLIIYKWDDCRKVGHTTLYCFMDMER